MKRLYYDNIRCQRHIYRMKYFTKDQLYIDESKISG